MKPKPITPKVSPMGLPPRGPLAECSAHGNVNHCCRAEDEKRGHQPLLMGVIDAPRLAFRILAGSLRQ